MSFVLHDSPLRRVPTSLDRKTVLFLDGIRYSIQMFELAARRLASSLDEISLRPNDSIGLSDQIADAMSSAWMMIDCIHRLRELLQQAPRLKKKEPELQLFLRRTAPVECLRHYFQHFRTEIDTFAERGMPLWGTLSWAYINRESGQLQNHTIAPGSFFDGVSVASCTFDWLEQKFVERVLLHAGPKKVDLADLQDWTADFLNWYTGWFQLHFSCVDHLTADMHIKLFFQPSTGETNKEKNNKE